MVTGLQRNMPGQHQVCPKPLAGKVFYLDLPSNKKSEALENDIKILGGSVEKFFSKEIKYLVSNKREAKYVKRLRYELAAPSPDSGQSSPFPLQKTHQPGTHKNGSRGQMDLVVTSRGKSLVDRVVKEQERIQMNKTLSNALDWGVKVLYIDDVMAYVEKRKKTIVSDQSVTSAPVKKKTKAESKAKSGLPKFQAIRIIPPFIKVEDSSRHYRPIYVAMSKMPKVNLTTTPPCNPFYMEGKDQTGKKHGHSEEKGQVKPKKNQDKKQVGFCEGCMVNYDNLIKHVQSESHMAFSRSGEYLVLDRLVSTMQCSFAAFKHKTKRPKCSVSSTLVVQGPHRKVSDNHAGDLVHMPTLKAEMAPSRDNSRVSLTNPKNHSTSVKKTSAVSLCHREDLQKGLSPRSRLVASSQKSYQQKLYKRIQDPSLVCDTNGQVSQEETTHTPAYVGSSLPSGSPSAVGTIQRKVKVHKRKRRKVDTSHQQVKSTEDVPDNGILSLWKLLQSSDDMDVEFLGFED